MVTVKRVYEAPADTDGYRVLIDGLWPRGVSKANAHLDAWEKEVAPSAELRKWYGHDPEKWADFQTRYARELKRADASAALKRITARARRGRVTLVYASHAGEISNAAVLLRLLLRRLSRASRQAKSPER